MRLPRESFLFLFIILSSLLITSCNSEEENNSDDKSNDDEDPPKSCGKYIYDFVEGIVEGAITCLGGKSSFKVKSVFEYATRSGCLLKCIFQYGKILNEEGLVDIIEAVDYVEKTFDAPVREVALPLIQDCFKFADKFDPKDYWCKVYVEFTDCALKAILAGLIPYGGDCFANPVIGTLFSALKYLTPDSPSITEDIEELRRVVTKKSEQKIRCLDKNCTQMYEYKRINGTKSMVLYDKDMQVILVKSRQSSKKSKKPK